MRGLAWVVTQIFRNAPWLVLLFYCMLLMPFELHVGGLTIPLARLAQGGDSCPASRCP